MTFEVTSNSTKKGRGRGVRNVFKFFDCFQEGVIKRKSHFEGGFLNNFAIAWRYRWHVPLQHLTWTTTPTWILSLTAAI